jgi:hypothetical protein
MTKEEFRNLSIGDIVTLNGRCHGNKGIRCVVDYMIDDRIHVYTLDGTDSLSIIGGMMTNWNEISYKSADII